LLFGGVVLCSQTDIDELKDMSIKSVERRNGNLFLILESSSGSINMELRGIGEETAIFYGPGKVPVPGPEPDFPLDLVETAEVDSTSVTLSGYWRIEATSIHLGSEQR
jgi:hypothetical protein